MSLTIDNLIAKSKNIDKRTIILDIVHCDRYRKLSVDIRRTIFTESKDYLKIIWVLIQLREGIELENIKLKFSSKDLLSIEEHDAIKEKIHRKYNYTNNMDLSNNLPSVNHLLPPKNPTQINVMQTLGISRSHTPNKQCQSKTCIRSSSLSRTYNPKQ